MKQLNHRIQTLLLGLSLALACSNCAGPAANQATPAAATGSVQISGLPAQLGVNQQVAISAEFMNQDGSRSDDVLWAFLEDNPSDTQLENTLTQIWQGSVTPLKYHFGTTRVVYLSNRLTGRQPGTVTVIAASRLNPKIRSKALLQVVP